MMLSVRIDGGLTPGQRAESEEAAVTRPSRSEQLRARFERFEQSAAMRFWSQLSATDFMNSSFAFAALAVLTGRRLVVRLLGADHTG
jgi:hypothetical protein